MASEYIGRIISLTSLSDIRYVGTLREIDKNAATIALESVRSMGTEGRKSNPAEELPPNDSTYECARPVLFHLAGNGEAAHSYIVFRASDVKNLSIEPEAPKPAPPPQLPQDPAILNSGTRGFAPDGMYGQPPFPGQPPYGFPGQPGPPPFGNYPGYSPFGGPPPPGPGFPPQGMPGRGPPPPSMPEQSMSPSGAPPPQGPSSAIAPPVQRPQPMAAQGQPTPSAVNAPAPSAPANPQAQAQKSAQVPITAPPNAVPAAAPKPIPAPAREAIRPAPAPAVAPSQPSVPQPRAKPTSFAQAAAAPRANGTAAPTANGGTQSIETGVADLDVSGQQTRRGNRAGQTRAPAVLRQPPQAQTGKPMPIPGDDFDFARANAKFQKDDVEPPQVDTKSLYDKSSSFFDNISSDLSDKTNNQRFDRQKERQQNVDTFGEPGSNHFFRGRGRGRGGRGRGGFRGRGRGQQSTV